MKFGLTFSMQVPPGTGGTWQQPYADMLACLPRAEELGYHSMFMVSHHAQKDGLCPGRRLRVIEQLVGQHRQGKQHGDQPAQRMLHVASPSFSSSTAGEGRHIWRVSRSTATCTVSPWVRRSPVAASVIR